MIVSLLYVLLAIFGLSVLIFFHELGHYFMARHVGMKVETFAIGFGKPVYSWNWNGVKWQIGWLLFGGYVKIAGQDTNDARDPYEIPDSFFGKPPTDRIKVALAGPLVNLLLALLIFTAIWGFGGREKHFAEFTSKIGWVDPHSEAYALGVRPGDEIQAYGSLPYKSAKDHLYAPMTSSGDVTIKGKKVDYVTLQKEPYEYVVKTYPHPNAVQKGVMTAGLISPANYIIYDKLPENKENPIFEGSPLHESGIQYGDRILWVDGELVFSGQQLSHMLNDDRVLLTVFRKGTKLLVRVPRVHVQELKMDTELKEELADWQYEAGLNNIKFSKLYVIPYNLTNDDVVVSQLKFIDKDKESEIFPEHSFDLNETTLLPKDKIIAIDGVAVKTSYDLLGKLQSHLVNIIVERDPVLENEISSKLADAAFDGEINWNDISIIANSIGTNHVIRSAGNYVLLKPVAPKMRSDFELTPEKQALAVTEVLEQRKEIESIEDPEKRAYALSLLNAQEKQLLLGLPNVQDRKINYNPTPWTQFSNVFEEIWRTLEALVTGALNPKWMSGPIGIVQVVHDNWLIGIKEALFWLGAISLNLGVLNLLPIPVLDGGTIALSLWEMITRRRLSPKVFEKIIFPFAVLLIIFFVFLTYQDLSRLFSGLFRW